MERTTALGYSPASLTLSTKHLKLTLYGGYFFVPKFRNDTARRFNLNMLEYPKGGVTGGEDLGA
jgi:hypothetical protein